jgi:hypothetical protein
MVKVLCLFAIVLLATLIEAQKALVRAPSTAVSCNCQCSNYQWRHSKGIQGNCASRDESGAFWCYIDFNHPDCDDRVRSSRRDSYGRTRLWSYQACTTPALGSSRCRNNFGSNFHGGSNSFGSSHNSGGFRQPGRKPVVHRPTRRPQTNVIINNVQPPTSQFARPPSRPNSQFSGGQQLDLGALLGGSGLINPRRTGQSASDPLPSKGGSDRIRF